MDYVTGLINYMESKMQRYAKCSTKRNGTLLGFLYLSLLAWNCIEPPLEPKLPTWDVALSLPVVNRTYTLAELLENNPDLLTADVNGLLMFSTTDTLESYRFGDVLVMDPVSDHFDFEIGVFELNPSPVQFKVPLEDHIPYAPLYEGPSEGVAPSTITGTIPPIESIEYMICREGTVGIHLENRSGIPLEFPDGLTIRNSDDLSVLVHFPVDGLVAQGEQRYVESALVDSRIYRTLEYEFTFASPPASGIAVSSNPDVAFTINFHGLSVEQARARIPEQKFDGGVSQEIEIEDSTFIKRATFSEGRIEVQLHNGVDMVIPVTLRMDDLRMRIDSGIRFSSDLILQPNSSASVSIDLREWMIFTESNTLIERIPYVVETGTIIPADDYSTVSAHDKVTGSVSFGDGRGRGPVIDSIEGRIKPTRHSVNNEFVLDIGNLEKNFDGEVTFADARLSLDLFLNSGYDAHTDFRILGENKYGVRDSLVVPANERRLTAGARNTIVFDKTNSRINEFLAAFVPDFPEQLVIVGEATINPDYTEGQVDTHSSIDMAMTVDIPLHIGIKNGVVRDTVNIGGFDGTFDREQFDYINQGKIYFESVNGVALGFGLRLCLLDRYNMVLKEFPVEGQMPIGIAPASVNKDGLVSGEGQKDIRHLDLTNSDIEIFRYADRAALIIDIETDETIETSYFRTSDSLRMKIYGSFSLKADFN